MDDCDICFSAGSVNKWGVCEVCGEELEHEPVEAVPAVPPAEVPREETLADAPEPPGPNLREPGPRPGERAGERFR